MPRRPRRSLSETRSRCEDPAPPRWFWPPSSSRGQRRQRRRTRCESAARAGDGRYLWQAHLGALRAPLQDERGGQIPSERAKHGTASQPRVRELEKGRKLVRSRTTSPQSALTRLPLWTPRSWSTARRCGSVSSSTMASDGGRRAVGRWVRYPAAEMRRMAVPQQNLAKFPHPPFSTVLNRSAKLIPSPRAILAMTSREGLPFPRSSVPI